MKKLDKRMKCIEGTIGFCKSKSYIFIHIQRPRFSDEGKKRILEHEIFSCLHGLSFDDRKKDCYKKDDFIGPVVIIEKQGKRNRWIDTASDEGKRILAENEYQVLQNENV